MAHPLTPHTIKCQIPSALFTECEYNTYSAIFKQILLSTAMFFAFNPKVRVKYLILSIV